MMFMKNLEDYNPQKKKRVLIAFDDMIAHMESNKKLSLIVIGLLLRRRKLITSLVFKTKCNTFFYHENP